MELHLDFTAADERLRARAEHAVREALSARQDRIESVAVRVRIGMPRGEHRDAYCLVRLQLAGAAAFTILDMNSDPLAAVARAMVRARRTVEAQVHNATTAGASRPEQPAKRRTRAFAPALASSRASRRPG
jgi:hypothetical protein